MCIGYGFGRCLQYGWDWFIYHAQPNKTLSAKKNLWAQNLEGPSQSCSWCKHGMHWQVENCDDLQISIFKMIWKVVANKLCVVVCKPNGLDDIGYIWELDDEPQCTVQISKVEYTFNYGQLCY